VNNVDELKDERKKRETNEEGESYPTTMLSPTTQALCFFWFILILLLLFAGVFSLPVDILRPNLGMFSCFNQLP
jgi:hypothetical protein